MVSLLVGKLKKGQPKMVYLKPIIVIKLVYFIPYFISMKGKIIIKQSKGKINHW